MPETRTDVNSLLQPLRDLVHPSQSCVPADVLIEHIATELRIARLASIRLERALKAIAEPVPEELLCR